MQDELSFVPPVHDDGHLTTVPHNFKFVSLAWFKGRRLSDQLLSVPGSKARLRPSALFEYI